MKIKQLFCKHHSGITIVKEAVYSAGCVFSHRETYIKCTNCGKIMIDSSTMEEYTGIKEAKKNDRSI